MARKAWNSGLKRSAKDKAAIAKGTRKGYAKWRKRVGEEVYKQQRVKAGKKTSNALKGRQITWMKGFTYEEMYGTKEANRLRNLRSISMKGIPKSSEHKEKIALQRAYRVISFVDTRPEKAVAKFLYDNNIPFVQHSLIKGCNHQFDFILRRRKIVIEVDGCYWHGCRKCCSELSQPAKLQYNRDRWWNKRSKELGWTMLRIWEHDISANNFIVLIKVLGIKLKGKSNGKSNIG